jgi:hypothetical protein
MRGCSLAITALLAWVLWTESDESTIRTRHPATTNTIHDWTRVAAFDSQGQCETALRQMVRSIYERMLGVRGASVDRTASGVFVSVGSPETSVTRIRKEMTCFPDTVDPRR